MTFRSIRHSALGLSLGALALVAGGCTVSSDSAPDTAAVVSAPATDTAALATTPVPVDSGMMTDTAATSTQRLEVDITARRVTLFEGDRQVATHPVAVGSSEWPTQKGSWKVTQVVWNPEWTPPDESWADERQPRKPGDPKNPLGKIQLVYDPPRTIHGTNQPASVGKAVSHGSIRMTNEAGIALAKLIMEGSGVGKDAAWYEKTQSNRTEKVIVDLPRPVPIRVF